MPRNVPKPLTAREHLAQRVNATTLRSAGKEGVVAVTYIKRNGEPGKAKGTVSGFSGKPSYDTGSVTIIDEEKGPRTINLHLIASIK